MDSTTHITCRNCGSQWRRDFDVPMFHFQPLLVENTMTTPKEISLAGRDMEYCPKCPLPGVDDAMQRGDSRTGDEMYRGDKQ